MGSAGDSLVSEPDILAAGAVVVRKGQVLLVHRPKNDDWTFPKGKQDPGEHELRTALREVEEETGLRVRLGLPLQSVSYLQGPALKVVHYWMGRAVGDTDVSSYQPNEEIDRVEWVPFDKAEAMLTYQRDLNILEEAAADPRRTTPLIILRHAKARARNQWNGDDRSRPLTPTGHGQSQRLVPLLAAYGVTRVVTSSSVRCSDTVWPYAIATQNSVAATPALSEECASPTGVRQVLGELLAGREPTVVCTHRPVLPTVLEQLGLSVDELRPAEMVVLHHRKGQVKAVERHYSG